MSPEALAYSPTFNRSQVVLGGDNETILKRVAGPQIVPVYGNDFRSTPVFFMQDDHDYFDNDEATDEAVTFPPSQFMLSLARATQNMCAFDCISVLNSAIRPRAWGCFCVCGAYTGTTPTPENAWGPTGLASLPPANPDTAPVLQATEGR